MAVSRRCPADHHGPLVPPPAFVRDAPCLEGEELKAATDRAIVELIELQEDSWISVVTDGELRRVGRPRAIDPLAECGFLAGRTEVRTKVRLPRPGGKNVAIADPAQLKGLIELGVGYIELDGSVYAPLLRRAHRVAMRAAGGDPDARIADLLAADAAVLNGVFPTGEVKLAVCFHDISDPASAAFTDGLETAAAEQVLHGLPVQRFMFDCGGGPEPDFSFLTLVPEKAEIVLGLIDGSAEQLPDPYEIVRQVDRAAGTVDTDRLSLSPRHGFYIRNGVDPQAAWDRQRDALDFLLDTSSRAWGIDF